MRISDWSSDVCSSDLASVMRRSLEISGLIRKRRHFADVLNAARASGRLALRGGLQLGDHLRSEQLHALLDRIVGDGAELLVADELIDPDVGVSQIGRAHV